MITKRNFMIAIITIISVLTFNNIFSQVKKNRTKNKYNQNKVSTITVNDPEYSNQWNLQVINAPDAWEITTGTSTTKIAVMDDGVQRTHLYL
jgi:hypothetical protein